MLQLQTTSQEAVEWKSTKITTPPPTLHIQLRRKWRELKYYLLVELLSCEVGYNFYEWLKYLWVFFLFIRNSWQATSIRKQTTRHQGGLFDEHDQDQKANRRIRCLAPNRRVALATTHMRSCALRSHSCLCVFETPVWRHCDAGFVKAEQSGGISLCFACSRVREQFPFEFGRHQKSFP